MKDLFNGSYNGKKVLVTGHSGFKGSWLVYWLFLMGADVVGFSLEPPTKPNHISLLKDLNIVSIIGDIRNKHQLEDVFKKYQFDIIFHLAAQPLVRQSYRDPIETYETNLMGTLYLFEMARKFNIKALVNITTDKVYENKEQIWGYREDDPLEGYDPYSSSKSCSEILTQSYRNSFFNPQEYKKTHNTLLATCRAGNVIGGGDWAKERIMSDIIYAIQNNMPLTIRYPKAVRPWQHVLEPLSGYLMLGTKLLEEDVFFAQAWNFGPKEQMHYCVEDLVCSVKKHWNQFEYEILEEKVPHETSLLLLDCTKALYYLQWEAVWDFQTTVEKTILWYKNFYLQNATATLDDINSYVLEAKRKGLLWAA